MSLFVVLALLMGSGFTQKQAPLLHVSNQAWELSKLPKGGGEKAEFDRRCGRSEYFFFEEVTKPKPPTRRVGALVLSGSTGQTISFLREKYRVVLDESKNIPTIEYDSKGKAVRAEYFPPRELVVEDGMSLTVRITKAEYAKAASCLPKP